MTESQEEKTDILQAFAWRLNAAAEAKGLAQVDIAAKMGLKPARVRNWFQGLNFPRTSERPTLASILDVPRDWLFKETTERDSPPSSSVVREDSEPYGVRVREIPLVSWAHAGAAANFEALPKHWQGTVASTSRDKRAFALTIEGDSMEPRFLAGDRVVLEPSHSPVSGKPVVAKFINESVQLRIYTKLPNGKIRLAPYNPLYPAIEHSAKEFAWIWPVKELVRAV